MILFIFYLWVNHYPLVFVPIKMNLGLQKYFLGMLIKRGDMFY